MFTNDTSTHTIHDVESAQNPMSRSNWYLFFFNALPGVFGLLMIAFLGVMQWNSPREEDWSIAQELPRHLTRFYGFHSMECNAAVSAMKYNCVIESRFDDAPSVAVRVTVPTGKFADSLSYKRSWVTCYLYDCPYGPFVFRADIDYKKHARDEVIQWVVPLMQRALDLAAMDSKIKASITQQTISDSYK